MLKYQKTFLSIALILGSLFSAACTEDDDIDGTDTPGDGGVCSCSEGATISADPVLCANFGDDAETCGGWESCEVDNGMFTDSLHADGTTLTCFGCELTISCP